MTQSPTIRKASAADIPLLWEIIQSLGAAKDAGYFEHCIERQDAGDLWLLIVHDGPLMLGYGILNWMPKYGLYRKLGIPEVQDLNVLHAHRRRGIATHLINYCEDQARGRGKDQMGIAVSVHGSFGPAQRLYFKLGYAPDGQGASYDRAAIDFASLKPVDDQLCMMLVKDL